MQPFLAMVVPVSNPGPVDPGWGGGTQPGHPGNRPPGSWGGPVDPGWGVRPPVDPGYGRPGWSPVDPGYGVGGGFRPDNSLPWAPGHPGNRPPGSGGGPVDPGWGGGWGSGNRPDNSLPGGGHIDNSLPWAPGLPDNSLPPGAQPKVYAATVPPKPPESVNTEEGAWVIVHVNGMLAWAWAQKPPTQSGDKPGIDNTLPETPEPK